MKSTIFNSLEFLSDRQEAQITKLLKQRNYEDIEAEISKYSLLKDFVTEMVLMQQQYEQNDSADGTPEVDPDTPENAFVQRYQQFTAMIG
jgi:hypothetical protein